MMIAMSKWNGTPTSAHGGSTAYTRWLQRQRERSGGRSVGGSNLSGVAIARLEDKIQRLAEEDQQPDYEDELPSDIVDKVDAEDLYNEFLVEPKLDAGWRR